MIKCKLVGEGDNPCGKTCCCLVCEEKETCEAICGYVAEGRLKEPKDCKEAILEGNELKEFENNSFAIIRAIANIASKKKELDEQDKEMRMQLEKAMDQFGVKSFENDLVKITYVEPTTRTSVDSAKLKKKYPDVYAECSKVSEVKGSVRIAVK